MKYKMNFRPIGSAIYPNFALLNHSCDQNTSKYFAGDTVVVVASKVRLTSRISNRFVLKLQNISAGEEVTENYFPMAQVIPRAERRSWLSDHYWLVSCILTSELQMSLMSGSTVSAPAVRPTCPPWRTSQRSVPSKAG